MIAALVLGACVGRWVTVNGFDANDACLDAPLPCHDCYVTMTSLAMRVGKRAVCQSKGTLLIDIIAPCKRTAACGVLHINNNKRGGKAVLALISMIKSRQAVKSAASVAHIFAPSLGREFQKSTWLRACEAIRACRTAQLCVEATSPWSKAKELERCLRAVPDDAVVLVLDIDMLPTEDVFIAVEEYAGTNAVYAGGLNFFGPGIVAVKAGAIRRAGGFMPSYFTKHGCEDTSLAARLVATGTNAVMVNTRMKHRAHGRSNAWYTKGRQCYEEEAVWLRNLVYTDQFMIS